MKNLTFLTRRGGERDAKVNPSRRPILCCFSLFFRLSISEFSPVLIWKQERGLFFRQINVSFSVDLVTRVSGIEGKIGRIDECVTVSRPQLPVIFKCNLISQTLFFFSSFLAEFCQRLSGKVFLCSQVEGDL